MKKHNEFKDFDGLAYIVKYENITFGNEIEKIFPRQVVFKHGIDWTMSWEDRIDELIFLEFHRYCGNHKEGHGEYKATITKLIESGNTFRVIK